MLDFVVDCLYIRRVKVMLSSFAFTEYRSFASHITSKESDMNLVQNREESASTKRIESVERIEENRLRSAIEETSEFSRFSR